MGLLPIRLTMKARRRWPVERIRACLLGGVTRFGFIASPLRQQQLLPPLKDASKTLL
jgi:hypothetical protein